jgi:hypothetical protein
MLPDFYLHSILSPPVFLCEALVASHNMQSLLQSLALENAASPETMNRALGGSDPE